MGAPFNITVEGLKPQLLFWAGTARLKTAPFQSSDNAAERVETRVSSFARWTAEGGCPHIKTVFPT
jgi:hypothetical protein